MVNNIFHKTITDITANTTKTFGISEDEKRQVDNKAFNFLVAYSNLNKLTFLQLNNNINERIPIPASGGRVVIEKDDNINFSSIELVEENGDNALGKIYITFGVL